jgi:hypothetical protein
MAMNWLLPVGLVAQALNRKEVIRTGKKFLYIKVNTGICYNRHHFNASFYLKLKNVLMHPGYGFS